MITLKNISADMIANNLYPSNPIHPGEMIKDELESRGITQKALAKQMDVSYSVLNEILNGKRPVTIHYALMLEAALGIPADIWIRLQADYDLQVARTDKSFAGKLEHIRQYAAML